MKKDWYKYDKKTKDWDRRKKNIDIVEFLLNYILAPILLVFWGIWRGISKFIKDVLSKSYWIIVGLASAALVTFLLAHFMRK